MERTLKSILAYLGTKHCNLTQTMLIVKYYGYEQCLMKAYWREGGTTAQLRGS